MNNGEQTNWRIEFTVDRKTGPVRKSVEGTNLERLMAKVDKMDGYNIVTLHEAN